MMSGATSWLSVILVTVVSVKVDLVIVSVTRPRAAGGGGSITAAGGLSTVTRTPLSGGSATGRCPPRKCAGIIAWNSSFVIGREGCAFNTFTSDTQKFFFNVRYSVVRACYGNCDIAGTGYRSDMWWVI